MSSWIKLVDQSFTNTEKRNHRAIKTTNRETVSADIEDDSSQESFDLNFSAPVKRRKTDHLENLTIQNEVISSDECSDVEYNPDDSHLPNTGNRQRKTILSIIKSTEASTSSSQTTEKWTPMTTINTGTAALVTIDDSLSDSSDSSSHTLIDESSTDSSEAQSASTSQQQTMIDTQDSITPPVAPFIVDNTSHPKKRKVRTVKGGLVERLKKSLSLAKSNLLFWQHHRSAELLPPGIAVTVNRVENTYGRVLVHTKLNDKETIFSLCSKSLQVEEGDIIEVDFGVGRGHITDAQVLYPYVDKVSLIKKGDLK